MTFSFGGLRVLVWALLVTLALSPIALGQTNEEISAGIQFNFSPPGARSLAMGGAFIGLADDATAAYANPAGLGWLTRSEFSLEGRYSNYNVEYPYGGSLSDPGAGLETGLGIDTVQGVVNREFSTDVTNLNFLAGTWVPKSERWRLALYRHELASYQAVLESQGAFIRGSNGRGGANTRNRSRLQALAGNLELEIVNYGVSGAVSFVDEKLWVGLGVSWYDFDYNATNEHYRNNWPICSRAGDPSSCFASSGESITNFETVLFDPSRIDHVTTQYGEDDDVGGQIGLLWRGDEDRWSVGAVYRIGPEFQMSYDAVYGNGALLNASGDWDFDGQTGELIQDQTRSTSWEVGHPNFTDLGELAAITGDTSFKVPDVYGLGFMWKPWSSNRDFQISFEWAHITYSDLAPTVNHSRGALRNDTGTVTGGAPADCGDWSRRATQNIPPDGTCVSPLLDAGAFVVDDGDEFRFGMEYVAKSRSFLFPLRLGTWFDPDHQLRFELQTDPQYGSPTDLSQDRFVFRFPEGKDVWHFTGGVGFRTGSLQLDLGFDLSDRADIFSLSTVYMF